MWLEKKWLLKNEADAQKINDISSGLGISDVIARILIARGIDDISKARAFLYGQKDVFHQPFLLKDMDKAVKRIRRAIDANEKIVVYGDYDVDGITASALLLLFFKKLGVDIKCYVPERQTEGYGLNDAALKRLYEEGYTLVITVDCGISAADEVKNAPSGMEIIITDHHTPPDELPKALAVVNPKQVDCGYPCKDLAGVGVAFKLCQALWQDIKETKELFSEYMDIVALGTISDIVPLLDENREIARLGIEEIAKTANQGIKELIKVSGLSDKMINVGHIGFMIAPRLNAAGRLDNAQIAVDMLTTDDQNLAAGLAGILDQENRRRQQIEKEIFEEAEAVIKTLDEIGPVLVLASGAWHTGVIGIVASRLVEKYYVPVIMINVGEDVCKASCRSIPDFNMYEALSFAEEYLLKYGGHHQAAGFSIKEENIPLLAEKLKEYSRLHMTADDYIPSQRVDALLDDFTQLDFKLLDELSRLEPCGMANPSPVLAIKGVHVKSLTVMGNDGKHLKFSAVKGDKSFPAIMWQKSYYQKMLYDGAQVDIAFMPSVNEWRGNKDINLIVSDIRKEKIFVDFRYEDTNSRNDYLKNLLKDNGKTFIYCPSNKECARIAMDFSAYNAEIGYLPENNADSLVIIQPPYLLWDDALWWEKLKESNIRKVYLMYNITSIKRLIEEAENATPDINWLRKLYRFIAGKGTAVRDDLVEFIFTGNEDLLRNGLTILEEIGVITEKNGTFTMMPVEKDVKLDINLSQTYVSLKNKEEKIKKDLGKCMNIGRGDFARMIFGS